MSTILPSKLLFHLITDVWSDPTGRIFLLSLAYYLFTAFTFTGYMAYFAGGLGNVGLGDYSLTDFLFFLPTIAFTGLNIIVDNIKRVIKNIFLYFIAPNFGGIWAASILYGISNFVDYLPAFLLTPVFLWAAFITWLIGFTILLSISPRKLWLSVLLQFLGIMLFSVVAVGMVIKGVVPAPLKIDPTLLLVISFGVDSLVLLTGISTIFLVLLLTGRKIASEAMNYKYLSPIVSIELTQPVSEWENWRVQHEPVRNTFFSLFNPKQPVPSIYQYKPIGNAHLVASLRRVTAVYIQESQGTSTGKGRMFLVSNTNIHSLELRPGKTRKTTD